MKLWLITRKNGESGGVRTFYGAVVAAETEEAAKITHPAKRTQDIRWNAEATRWEFQTFALPPWMWSPISHTAWPAPSEIEAKLLGEAAPGTAAGSILCDYDATP